MAAIAVAMTAAVAAPGPAVARDALTHFPAALAAGCRDGVARIFDQCGNQRVHFDAAVAEANRTGKTVLVVMGAEWCGWCHVFARTIEGRVDRGAEGGEASGGTSAAAALRYTERLIDDSEADAEMLNRFVAARFVVAHIDLEYAPGGEDLLASVGALDSYGGGVPFIFTVDRQGRFAEVFDHGAVETAPSNAATADEAAAFTGYDRKKLLVELNFLLGAAADQN